MHILSFNQSNDAERQGAIKRDSLVLAMCSYSAEHAEQKLARIVEATVVSAEHDNRIFKYYVTFENENRRMD